MKSLKLFVLLLLISSSGFAQHRVTGKVVAGDTGEPIPYATVSFKGEATKYTTTDDAGAFSINLSSGEGTLVVSFVGYRDTEVAINNRSVIDVVLETDATTLEETIVVAYGTATKATFTGAASVVKQDAIKDVPSLSFESALSGKVAGMNITSSSGQAGATPTIRIRGTGSMNADKDPLYVIDGVPVTSGGLGSMNSNLATSVNSALNMLSPSDIESITVLKDAAASSLYGSRAANGVILIQTKRGKQGRARVDFKASVALTPSFATDNWEKASNEEQVEMYYSMFWDNRIRLGNTAEAANREALRQLNNRFNIYGYTFNTSDNTVNTLTIGGKMAGQYFDWEDYLFQTAVYQSYDASVSGGNENTTYYASLSYTKDDGRVAINSYERISGRLNLTQKIGKIAEASTNVNVSKGNQLGFNDSRNVSSNYFMLTRNMLWDMYWPQYQETITGDNQWGTGALRSVEGEWVNRFNSLAYNPAYHQDKWQNSSKTVRVSAIETLSVKLLPGLTGKTTFSYDNSNTRDFLYYSNLHYNGSASNVQGNVSNYNYNRTKLVSSTTLNFEKTFANKHKVAALAGWEAEKNNTYYLWANGKLLANSGLPVITGAGQKDAEGYSYGNGLLSFLSRVEYSYDDKYYFSASFRRDGSSRLGINTRWGNFWSVAGSWRISNEKFMQNIDWLSNLRLRASYGVNGTLPTSNYGHLALTSYGSTYNENPGGTLSTIPNPDLQWETNYTGNIALEFGLLKNKVTGTIEYFNRDSKDVLMLVPISRVTGLGTTLTNIGEMNNRGIEIELNGEILKLKDFRWDMGITASILKSKVVKLYDGQDIIWDSDVDVFTTMIYREGESPYSFYGLEYAGVERETGKCLWYLNNDQTPDLYVNGRPATYTHANADRVVIGSADPKVYGGISSNFSWKDISLSLGFIYKIGGNTYDGPGRDVLDDGYYWERVRSKDQYDNRWTPDNMDSKYPQMLSSDKTDALQRSSRWVNDASFIRLKNITLAYTLPKNIVSKVGMSNARVYFTGSNLWTWAVCDLYDPEAPIDGVKTWAMPIGKTYTFGIELSF